MCLSFLFVGYRVYVWGGEPCLLPVSQERN